MDTILSSFISSSQQNIASEQSVIESIQTLDSSLSSAQQSNVKLQDQVSQLQLQLSTSQPLIFDQLEREPWLLATGTAGNTGSTGSTAQAIQTVPGLLPASRKIIPNGPYADEYWYKKFGPQPGVVRFVQEGSFLFPSAFDSSSSQAVEFDLQQVIGGAVYNMGWQFDYAEGSLRYWDRSTGHWVFTGVTLGRQTPGTWVQCSFSTHRDTKNVYYDSCTISGVVQAIKSISFPAPSLKLEDMLNYGFQLDGNAAAQPYSVFIYGMKLTGLLI
jgi:hypothetical protein